MRIATLFGCQIVINGWFVLLLGILALSGWAAEALVIFGALFTHELAHLTVGAGFGIVFRRIELMPFGAVAEAENLYAVEPGAAAVTALAGPLNNLILLGAGYVLAEARWIHPPLADFTLRTNLALAALNLLPALPLDGGRLLHAVLRRHMGELASLRLLSRWGYLVAGGMVAGAAAALAFGIVLPTLPVLAVFVALGAGRERAAAAFGHLRPLWQRPELLASRGVLPAAGLVARADLTVGAVLRHVTGSSYHIVWVVDAALLPYARISEAELVRAAVDGRLDATLADLVARRPPPR